jgi:alpha-L-arabinofuranosidase
MVNAPEYRWKKTIGDRDRRPQYKGWWYPHSTNGFGIEEFLQFCEAAKFEKVFAINIEETPQDAGDLVEYLNGPATSHWGRERAKNGHPAPYGVKYIEIGNEEKTAEHYLERFKLLYDAMHARDPSVQFIIAAWWEPDNPTSKRIVQELDGKAALWDVHVGGDDLHEGRKVDALFTRMEKLVREWAPNTQLKACILEENGGRHDLQRALGHAEILNATQRHGDFVLLDCPANCLQPWQQNDNDWDQGQVFFTSEQVWGMPPYYAQQMASANHLPVRIASETHSPGDALDVLVTRSDDGSTLVLKVDNISDKPHRATIEIAGLADIASQAEATTLTGQLAAVNPPEEPSKIHPTRSIVNNAGQRFDYDFAAYSYTILRLKQKSAP